MNENTIISADALEELNNRYMLFYIGEAIYGVPLALVLEIIQFQKITHLPTLPHHIKGIVNLRGKVVPVIDVRLKLNLEERPYDDKTCIIVLDIHEMHIGLIVDSVLEVFTPAEGSLAPPPTTGDQGGKYLSSVGQFKNKSVLNIDCDKFLQNDLDLIL